MGCLFCVNIIIIAEIVVMITISVSAWEMDRHSVTCFSVLSGIVKNRSVFPMRKKLQFLMGTSKSSSRR